MNYQQSNSNISPTPELIDRLVDGELGESDRRELLLSFEQSPDGWRRCALAFLEAQCWRSELGDPRQSSRASQPVALPLPRKKSSSLKLLGTLAAMAACFLLGFVGFSIMWRVPGAVPGDLIASATAQRSNLTQAKVASAVLPGSKSSETPWQLVRLTPTGSNDPSQVVQLPAIQRQRLDPQWLQNHSTPIPEKVVRALQRSGYNVRTQQQLMPMALKDGRQLVVPVDQVELHYVGNQTY